MESPASIRAYARPDEPCRKRSGADNRARMEGRASPRGNRRGSVYRREDRVHARNDGPLLPREEQQLVEGLLAGDDVAVRAIYARFGRPVYTLGLRLLGTREAAEELTQDVFLTAWRKAARFDASPRTPVDVAHDDRAQPRRGPAPPRDRRDPPDARAGRRGPRAGRAWTRRRRDPGARRGRFARWSRSRTPSAGCWPARTSAASPRARSPRPTASRSAR